jgi:hypothetical protein
VYTIQYWCYLSQSWSEYQGGEYSNPYQAVNACAALASTMDRPCRVVDDRGNIIYQC